MSDVEYECHKNLMKTSWLTFYTGQYLFAISKASAKGSIATMINKLTAQMTTVGLQFDSLDQELQIKANSYTKFGTIAKAIVPKAS